MNAPRSYYDPMLTFPYGEPFYPPSSWQASVYEPYADMSPYVIAGAAPATPPSTLGHDFWGALQDAGHFVERQVHDLPNIGQSISHTLDKPAQILQAADNANAASASLAQAGEDAKRAIAEAQETVKTVKYIAYGLGGLAAVALVFSILKTATE